MNKKNTTNDIPWKPLYFDLIFIVLALAVTLGFCLYANQIWEDFFITFKFSKNLAEGNGLVYNPGVKVHGFTSPLGVLLPAFCHLASGCTSYLWAIWLFRILFCIPAYIGGGLFLMRSFRIDDPGGRLGFMVGLLYLVESKSVFFSVNGMEQAFMFLFLGWAIYLLRKDIVKTWLWMGLAWAGLMWTRPDSCVYVTVIAIAAFVFAASSRKNVVIAIIKAGIVATIVYLPWFAGAWIYYGSPVPHTILAKGAVYARNNMGYSFFQIFRKLPEIIRSVYAPPYPIFKAWPPLLLYFSYLLGLTALFYWIFPLKGDRLGRILSFMFCLMCFYLSFIPFCYPWYYPPVAMLGLGAIVSFLFAVGAAIKVPMIKKWFGVCAVVLALILMIVIFKMAVNLVKIQQEVVENGTRKQVGLWLRDHIKPGDRIYLECLGYIGYFSNGNMLDYPGLSTPEVTDLLVNDKDKKLDFLTIIKVLKPEWMAIRYSEFMKFVRIPYFRENYVPAKQFNSLPEIAKYQGLPDPKKAPSFYNDFYFIVFKRLPKPVKGR